MSQPDFFSKPASHVPIMVDDLGFLENPDSSNIFQNAASFAEFSQKLRPVRPDVGFQGAGVKCELKHLDSVYNGKGERVLLQGGSKFKLEHDRPKDAYEAALVRTQRWNNAGDDDGVELEIRSPHMKAALKAVVPEYSDAVIDSKHITLRDEPRCLFHYRNELFLYGASLQQNSEAQKQVSFLLEYMNKELSDEIYNWAVMVEFELDEFSLTGPSVEFQSLWMAFTPREQIFIPKEDSDSRSLVLEFDSMDVNCRCQLPFCVKTHYWTIVGVCIDHDSSHYGYRRIARRIKYFSGYMPLKNLKIIPLRFHPDASTIRETHLARGRKFTRLQGKHHRGHKGIASMLGRDRNYTLLGEEDSFPLQATWVSSILRTATYI
jgi:hypothetical protein